MVASSAETISAELLVWIGGYRRCLIQRERVGAEDLQWLPVVSRYGENPYVPAHQGTVTYQPAGS